MAPLIAIGYFGLLGCALFLTVFAVSGLAWGWDMHSRRNRSTLKTLLGCACISLAILIAGACLNL